MVMTMAAEEVTQIWEAFKADPNNQELRNRLVEMYLPLVKYNGERIWARLPEGVELDDLISAGVFGLMDAIDAFDLTRGVKFETYCVPRIRGAMLDELRTMDWVPRLVRSKASKLNEGDQIARSQARPPAHRGRTLRAHGHLGRRTRKNDTRRQRRQPDQPEQEMVRDRQLQGRPRDRHPRGQEGRRPHPAHPENDLMRLVTKGLNRNERLIIILYYYEELTMKEIGATLDLSESRVSQMHSSIVQRLQSQLDRRRPEFGT